ncbi:MAG: acyl--CoA ligase [Desulfobacteraceae bacterium]|nr:acyl--CoA ligase [Desulfobacteraceae bacterium]
MNIYDPVETNALKYPQKTAIVDKDQRISYETFIDKVNRVSSGLSSLGLRKGDRVALLMHNHADFLFCFYASMKLGLIYLGINIMLKKDEVNYIINDCKPKVLIANKEYLTFLDDLDLHKDGSMKVVSINNDENTPEGAISYEDFMNTQPVNTFTEDLGKDDIAVIGYTSGTTGFPKGATHTHENILAHLDGESNFLGFNSEDVILAALPFFQLPAFTCHPCSAFHVGGKLVIHEKFEAVNFINAIKEENVTHFSGVPTILQMIYSVSRNMDVDFSSVRFAKCAGAPLSMPLREKIEKALNFKIVHAYGMTEISLTAACEAVNAPSKGVSVGHILPYVRVRLVKEDGTLSKIGEDGEIHIGAERTFKSYWNKPAETKEALEGGWFRTGDIGRFDDELHLHIVDRKKDMIIRGGFNIFPVELERVLLEDPRIQEASIIGIPHERLGEVPKAYIVAEEGETITKEDVLEISRTKTAKFKAIEDVEIVDASFFPRNALGKVMKVELKKRL